MRKPILFLFAAAFLLFRPAGAQEKCYEFYPGKEGKQVFRAVTSNASVINSVEAELKLPATQRRKFIAGKLTRGNGGHNQPWSWHFTPSQWSLAEMSIEVCDGEPDYVEKNLDTWMQQVGSYCPWSGQVIRACPVSSVEPRRGAGGAWIGAAGEGLAFETDRSGSASVEVFSARGERLAALAAGRVDAGRHVMAAPRLAPGVYHFVLRLDGGAAAAKTLVLP